MEYIKLKLDSGYLLFSLDETSFGRDDMRRYGWAIKGQKASKKFKAMQSLSLVCCISPVGVVAYKFYKGGTNSIIFSDFLYNVF